MSDSNTSLEFIYEKKDENNNVVAKPYYGLLFSDQDDGTAILDNPTCKNREIILDQSVVKYLKQIGENIRLYTFQSNANREIWFINPLPETNISTAHNLIGFVSGDMIDDGEKITCTNALLNPVLEEPTD